MSSPRSRVGIIRLVRRLARSWASLRQRHRSGDDGDPEAVETALRQGHHPDARRWAEQREHFWSEFREGQRLAEDRSGSSR